MGGMRDFGGFWENLGGMRIFYATIGFFILHSSFFALPFGEIKEGLPPYFQNSSCCMMFPLYGFRPKWRYASSVTMRPRGVRLMNPSMMRYGS